MCARSAHTKKRLEKPRVCVEFEIIEANDDDMIIKQRGKCTHESEWERAARNTSFFSVCYLGKVKMVKEKNHIKANWWSGTELAASKTHNFYRFSHEKSCWGRGGKTWTIFLRFNFLPHVELLSSANTKAIIFHQYMGWRWGCSSLLVHEEISFLKWSEVKSLMFFLAEKKNPTELKSRKLRESSASLLTQPSAKEFAFQSEKYAKMFLL